jgi:hypothetical protein
MPETIYVQLLDEGTDVWRPVEATRLADNVFTILGVIPDDEVWAFPPGSRVLCEPRSAQGEADQLVAMALAN